MGSNGVSLECLLSYKKINLIQIKETLDILLNHDFQFRESNEVVIYTGDFENLTYEEFLNNFLSYTGKNSINSIIINLEGFLDDIATPLSLEFDMQNNILVISFPLKKILPKNPNLERPNFNRLLFFGKLCNYICEKNPPKYAFLGEESLLTENFSVDILSKKPNDYSYSSKIFSSSYLKELFDSYTNW